MFSHSLICRIQQPRRAKTCWGSRTAGKPFIPTTAAAEFALLHSRAQLPRISWSFCGNFRVQPLPQTSSFISYPQLRHTRERTHTHSLHMCACDWRTHSTSKGNRRHYSRPWPTLIKMWQLAYCSSPPFFFVSHWFPWPDLILGSHIWALIRGWCSRRES